MRLLLFCLALLAAVAGVAQPNRTSIDAQVNRILREKTILRDGLTLDSLMRRFSQPSAPATLPIGEPGRPSAPRSDYEGVVSNSPKWEAELSAALNPLDSNNYLVGSMNLESGPLGGVLNVPIYFTTNGGQSWQAGNFKSTPLNSPFALVLGGGDPVLAYSDKGEVFISWLLLYVDLFATPPGRINLYLSKSTDGGASWLPPDVVDYGEFVGDLTTPTGLDGALVDKQWMVFDNSPNSPYRGNLYISYTYINSSAQGLANKILVKTRKPDGSLGPAVKANSGDYLSVQFSSIDAAPDGKVHLIFLAETDSNEYSLFHAISLDGGQTFQPENLVSPVHFPGILAGVANPILGIDSTRQYPCPHVKVNPANGNVLAAWTADGITAQETDGHDIYLAISTDAGMHWSTPAPVNPGPNPSAEQFVSSICITPDGTVGVAYYDRTDDPEGTLTDFVISISRDEGQSFLPLLKLSCEPSDFQQFVGADNTFGIGEYNQMVCTHSYMIPFWSDGRKNNADLDIYTARVPLGGSVSAVEIEKITPLFWASSPVPNPSSGRFALDVALRRPSPIRFDAYDATGKNILSEHPADPYAVGYHVLSYELPPGVWYYRIESDYGSASGIVVVR